MGKWAGKVGFAEYVEVSPGYYEEQIVAHPYYGNIESITSRSQSSGNVNDDIVMSNKISILADPFARKNFHTIKYATFMDTKWKVTDVTVQYPRLILSLGGVYNDNE